MNILLLYTSSAGLITRLAGIPLNRITAKKYPVTQ
jgi:hypothetical protein